MALSDDEVARQINQMKRFIKQEATEKADEILVKAEEEFNIEKGRLIQSEKIKIDNYYDRKEKQVELQRKIQKSTLLNQARLSLLKAKDDQINRILDEARGKLSTASNDMSRYKDLLKNIITQGLFQLLEKKVSIKCRKQDVNIVKSVYELAVKDLKNATGIVCKIEIESENLPADSCGGVELYAHGGKIKLTNTLESRLELLGGQMLPEVRTILFGANPNRHFMD